MNIEARTCGGTMLKLETICVPSHISLSSLPKALEIRSGRLAETQNLHFRYMYKISSNLRPSPPSTSCGAQVMAVHENGAATVSKCLPLVTLLAHCVCHPNS